MDKIIVEFDEDVYDALLENLAVRNLNLTLDYILENSTHLGLKDFKEIEEQAENFKYLEEKTTQGSDKNSHWWDVDSLPEIEVMVGSLDFQEYITLLRTQGEEKIVH